MRVKPVLALVLLVAAGPGSASERALGLVQQWVIGRYDNSAQASMDLANPAVPDEEKHRLMYQLFVPVTAVVPAIPGYLVYQQSSVDGSEEAAAITRAGLLQFFIDQSGQLRQRELNFKDLDAFKNLHLDPERMTHLTPDDFNFDPGCDFLLELGASGTEVAGPIRPGACRFFSQGLGKELIAEDAVTIRPDEFWFLGRFVDEAGVVMWGNASDEPVKMRRVPAAGSQTRPEP